MTTDWQRDNLTMHFGDCLDVMADMPDSSVDLIATDPPYFKVKGLAWDRQWDKPAAFLTWLDRVVAECARLLKANGSLYLFASPRMAARVECLVAERLCVLNRITWRKPPFSTKAEMFRKDDLRAFFPASEAVIFAEHYNADTAAKGESGYGAKCDELRGFVFEPLRAYLDGELSRSPLTKRWLKEQWMRETNTKSEMPRHWFEQCQWELPTPRNYEWLRMHLNASCNGDGPQYLRRDYEDLRRDYEDLRRDYEDLRRDYEDLRRPFAVTADVPYTDVWDFPTVQHYPGKHPCEKPLAMFEHIVRTSSREGAIVLDPFAGSGTTGVACRHEGREFVGIENDPESFETARRRLAAAANESKERLFV